MKTAHLHLFILLLVVVEGSGSSRSGSSSCFCCCCGCNSYYVHDDGSRNIGPAETFGLVDCIDLNRFVQSRY